MNRLAPFFSLRCFFFFFSPGIMEQISHLWRCLSRLRCFISLLGTKKGVNTGLCFIGNIILTLNMDTAQSSCRRKNVPAVVLFFGMWQARDRISAFAEYFCWLLWGIWSGVPYVYSKNDTPLWVFLFVCSWIGWDVFPKTLLIYCCTVCFSGFFQEKLLHRNNDFHATEDTRGITQRSKRSPGKQPDTGMSSATVLSLLSHLKNSYISYVVMTNKKL